MEALIHPDLLSLAQPVDSLLNLPGNPRRGDVAAVSRSYQQFGQRKPIVARRGDRTVLAGNHQLLAARELGWDRIAVVFVDDDDVTAGAFALADNRTSDLGEYDVDDLLALLQSVHAEASADLFAATGFDNEDLLAMIAAAAPRTVLNDPDEVPPAPTVPVTQIGDVWQLGPHRVICGSSTDPTVYTRLLADERADMIWTDPPYGVEYVGKTKKQLTIENDGRDLGDLGTLLRAAFSLTLAHGARAGAACYVAAPAGPATLAFATVLTDLGLWRQTLVWVKDRFVLGHSDYHYRHEIIYLGYTPGGEGRMGRGGANWHGNNAQDTVIEIARPGASREHPTMKPTALVAHCIMNSTAEEALVLDMFSGSGSTLIAAHDTGRIARCIELDPVYVDVICRRYQEHTGILPVLERTGEAHDFTTSN